MKNIQSMLQNAPKGSQEAPRRHNNPEDRDLYDFCKKAVSHVFDEIALIKPNSFQLTYADVGFLNLVKRKWAVAFLENQIVCREMIAAGLRALRRDNSNAVPSVGKFMAWCKEADDSFARFIDRKPMRTLAEERTKEQVGYTCRTQLSSAEARKLWYETLRKNEALAAQGLLENREKRLVLEKPESNTPVTQEKGLKNVIAMRKLLATQKK